MGVKATIENGEERQPKQSLARRQDEGNNLLAKVTEKWSGVTRFLTDVRAEMRKVVAPNRKEVENTTTVVIIAVFIFGIFFFVVDGIFANVMNRLLSRLAGMQ
jgi:preprotein translocase subunit SecE